jgi:hypothetical protein
MILGTIPPEIQTKEAMIVWAFSGLRSALKDSVPTPQYPEKITEAAGYFPSDILAVQELSTIDGGERHIIRILMPVDPQYYGSTTPVWQFVGTVVP